MNSAGDRANGPRYCIPSLDSQMKIDASPLFLKAFFCSRTKACSPSPYRTDMLTPKMPRRAYALSSTFRTDRRAAHDSRLPMEKADMQVGSSRTSLSTRVTAESRERSVCLLPTGVHLLS